MLNPIQLKYILYKNLDSKRFECAAPDSGNTVNFRLHNKATREIEARGWIHINLNGTLLFSTDFISRPKTIKTKELKKELQRFYKQATRKSLGLPVDKPYNLI